MHPHLRLRLWPSPSLPQVVRRKRRVPCGPTRNGIIGLVVTTTAVLFCQAVVMRCKATSVKVTFPRQPRSLRCCCTPWTWRPWPCLPRWIATERVVALAAAETAVAAVVEAVVGRAMKTAAVDVKGGPYSSALWHVLPWNCHQRPQQQNQQPPVKSFLLALTVLLLQQVLLLLPGASFCSSTNTSRCRNKSPLQETEQHHHQQQQHHRRHLHLQRMLSGTFLVTLRRFAFCEVHRGEAA